MEEKYARDFLTLRDSAHAGLRLGFQAQVRASPERLVQCERPFFPNAMSLFTISGAQDTDLGGVVIIN